MLKLLLNRINLALVVLAHIGILGLLGLIMTRHSYIALQCMPLLIVGYVWGMIAELLESKIYKIGIFAPLARAGIAGNICASALSVYLAPLPIIFILEIL